MRSLRQRGARYAIMKLGILGGTFDPVHMGHLKLAHVARQQFALEKVLFVPAFVPPHKTGHDLTPAPYRYRMVELAIRGEDRFEISDVELSKSEVSYTVETLKLIKQKYSESQLYFIMGEDSLNQLLQWKEPEKIKELATLLVAHRKGEVKQVPESKRVEWIEMPLVPFSSSEIRQRFQKGKPIPPQVLPDGVEEYIHKMNLYRDQ